MTTFVIRGIVQDAATGTGMPGLLIKAFDKDLVFDDVLGSAVTDQRGEFEILSEPSDFQEILRVRPDLYFKIFTVSGSEPRQVYSTESAVRWSADELSDLVIRVPRERITDARPAELVLLDENAVPRDELTVGESLLVTARYLEPACAHGLLVSVDGQELFTARLLSDAEGEIEPTVLWPQMGLDDPHGTSRYTLDEARAHWAGRTVRVALFQGASQLLERELRISSVPRPLVLCTDPTGRILNGFEVGTQALYLTLRDLPFSGSARLLMVPGQCDWRLGDSVVPVTLADGTPAIRELSLPTEPAEVIIEFAPADALRPGAFDFIVRPVRYGFEADESPILLPTDIVGSRRTTGVVVREPYESAKPVLGGCVNKLPLSGRSVAGAPYFRYADTFAVGENVYAAIDPAIVDPANVSKMCSLYVVKNKNDVQWNADRSLQHLPVLGGNGSTVTLKVQAGCVNANRVLIWPKASVPGDYDIVADFGANTASAAQFTPDHSYDTPLDIIDGYFVAGFRVVEDPGTSKTFKESGQFFRTETTNPPLALSPVTVLDELDAYASPAAFHTQQVSVNLRVLVHFPADVPGTNDPSQISGKEPSYPLVVVVHGNGHFYFAYSSLLEHLAKNGFIAASIHLEPNMHALGRANVLFEHLGKLKAMFGAKLQKNNVGLLGHSRGGEAVLKAARLNAQLGSPYGIRALLALAPTDQYGLETLTGKWAPPLLVLYGSRDGDVDGSIRVQGYTVAQTGFSLYDRARSSRKSMLFVHGATHNGFVTSNSDVAAGSLDLSYALPVTAQKTILAAYANAFFRRQLLNESELEGLFTGEWQPPSVEGTGAKLSVQYRHPKRITVDDSETAGADWKVSSIGGTVDHGGSLPSDPWEGRLRHHSVQVPGFDAKSPHDTLGLGVRWDDKGDRLTFSLPSPRDVSLFTTISFRIGQKADSTSNPANQPQDLRVALRDSGGRERAIRAGTFAEIPAPDVRADPALTKSAMRTVRIPLTAYTIACAGLPAVDLKKVTRLSFIFSEVATGEVAIDDVEFTI